MIRYHIQSIHGSRYVDKERRGEFIALNPGENVVGIQVLDNEVQEHDHTRMNEHDTDHKNCKQCGEPFSPKAEHQKFCSKKCHDLYWRKIRRIARDLAERGLA